MGLPILHFKGSQVEFLKYDVYSVPEGCFNLNSISVGLPILHFKGSQVEFLKYDVYSVPEGYFNLSKQC